MGAPETKKEPNEPFLEETSARRDALRERMNRASESLATRAAIAKTLGTASESILDRMEQLGFTGESARVLDLLPLVHVAWSDGRVQQKERVAILTVLEARGIRRESEPWLLMETLLERRPSETFLAESLALVRDIAKEGGHDKSDLVELCVTVAEASGRLLGIGSVVSAPEKALIRQIAAALGDTSEAAFEQRFGA